MMFSLGFEWVCGTLEIFRVEVGYEMAEWWYLFFQQKLATGSSSSPRHHKSKPLAVYKLTLDLFTPLNFIGNVTGSAHDEYGTLSRDVFTSILNFWTAVWRQSCGRHSHTCQMLRLFMVCFKQNINHFHTTERKISGFCVPLVYARNSLFYSGSQRKRWTYQKSIVKKIRTQSV